MGNYVKATHRFTDENGNKIVFDVQSYANTCGYEFQGYLVTLMNVNPDIDYGSRDAGIKQAAASKKLSRDAEKYFNEHPEQRPEDGCSRDLTYKVEYLRRQVDKEIRRQVAEDENVPYIFKVYVHQMDNKMGKDTPQMAYSYEQLIGKAPLDAPEEAVVEQIEKDVATQSLEYEARKNKEEITLSREDDEKNSGRVDRVSENKLRIRISSRKNARERGFADKKQEIENKKQALEKQKDEMSGIVQKSDEKAIHEPVTSEKRDNAGVNLQKTLSRDY